MNAGPILILIARLLARHRLEVVMIGNAAAAIQGSPVTTMDMDFMFVSSRTRIHGPIWRTGHSRRLAARHHQKQGAGGS